MADSPVLCLDIASVSRLNTASDSVNAVKEREQTGGAQIDSSYRKQKSR
jgi:hypothetical protein